MWRLLVGLYSRPFSLQSSRKLVKARDTARGALRRLLSAISFQQTARHVFCPSLTPLRFLTTLGRGGKQHCGNCWSLLRPQWGHISVAAISAMVKRWRTFLWFDRLTNHAKTVTAHNLADNNNFISRIQYFLLSLWDNKNNKNIIYG